MINYSKVSDWHQLGKGKIGDENCSGNPEILHSKASSRDASVSEFSLCPTHL
jgi:hypothetical protein